MELPRPYRLRYGDTIKSYRWLNGELKNEGANNSLLSLIFLEQFPIKIIGIEINTEAREKRARK